MLLEEQEGSVNFKFGVIYAKEGQTTDDEMLSNGNEFSTFFFSLQLLQTRKLFRFDYFFFFPFFFFFAEGGSPGFERFLETLGERIRLKGWDKYRGGLDVKGMSSLSDLFAS